MSTPSPLITDRSIAVIGAGTLGRRIALMFATGGGTVRVCDLDATQREKAADFIGEQLPAVLEQLRCEAEAEALLWQGEPDRALGLVAEHAAGSTDRLIDLSAPLAWLGARALADVDELEETGGARCRARRGERRAVKRRTRYHRRPRERRPRTQT